MSTSFEVDHEDTLRRCSPHRHIASWEGERIAAYPDEAPPSGRLTSASIRPPRGVFSGASTGPHAVLAGETWHFRAWFRDINLFGSTSNFTDGLEILFR